jgi:alcohol dehydrogenase class IV
VILPFSFTSLPKIIFGPGVCSQIAPTISQYGAKTVLITGGKSFKNSPYFRTLQDDLAHHKITYTTKSITAEPSPQDIDEFVVQLKNENVSSVVAIGGGSVLDAGKAISAMLKEEDGSVMDFLEGVGSKIPSGKKIPFIAVPTTSGTGSETTSNAVLSVVGSEGFKKSLRHDNFIPDIAIVDPELTLGCPPHLTATCGMDCFTQLVEAYLSTNGSSLTDALALQGIEAISRSLTLAYQQNEDINARSDLSYATMLSGIVLANAGLGTVHGFASAVGGVIPVPHGVVCGTLMEPANRLTLTRLRQSDVENPALLKYSILGKIFSDKPQQSDTWYQDHFIDTLAKMSSVLEIPDLSKYHITDETKEKILLATGNKYNPVNFDKNDLEKILKAKL